MSDESYPPARMNHLVRRVQNADASGIRRNWTGNDENHRNQHERVPLSESPLRLRLSWKKGPRDSTHLIGIFDLDLMRLLEAGYIRIDAESQDEVRLRFYHGLDNLIYVQVKTKEPGLPIGRMP